jgi:hypothetical protein
MFRIVEYYFLYSSNLKCFSRQNKKTKTKKQNKNQNKTNKHKIHLSSSLDPDHVVKKEWSLNMSIQEKTN